MVLKKEEVVEEKAVVDEKVVSSELVVKTIATETAEQVFDGSDKPVSDRELLVRIYNVVQELKGGLL